MKKTLAQLLSLLLVIGLLAGCGGTGDTPPAGDPDTEKPAETGTPADPQGADDKGGDTESKGTIRVGASPTPHADILRAAEPVLLELGYELELTEFNDYVLPNEALNNGELDANYFQHEPYLEVYNEENGTDLATAAYIHYEPLGLYPGTVETIDQLADGDKIAVPNDGSNEGRALKLLEVLELITLDPEAGFNATVLDIVENPLNLDIIEVEAAQIPRYLEDVAMAVINGNYAIGAGLNAETDAVAKEEKASESATTYANIICVEAGNEKRADILALVEALQSDTVQTFIAQKYEGAVVTIY